MTWTQFWDMHSGGGSKEKWNYIYIEAPEKEAEIIFQNRFGHNPHRVSCTCCGSDYCVDEYPTLEEATGFHRNCIRIFREKDDGTKEWQYLDGTQIPDGWKEDVRFSRQAYIPLAVYVMNDDVLVIRSEDIDPRERLGELRQQGYVWLD